MPSICVDAVIPFKGGVVLIRRARDPFKGKLVLPGGHLEACEDPVRAVIREVEEETGLKVWPFRLVGFFSDPSRDPRGHKISIAFLCKVVGGMVRGGKEGEVVIKIPKAYELGFDHALILRKAGMLKD